MSEELNTEEQAVDLVEAVDELTILKQRARVLGINFSNNIGLQALRLKVDAKLSETDDEVAKEAPLVANPLSGEPVGAKPLTIREIMLRDQMKLVRLRITNLDPKKKDLPGEILTIANEYLGTVKKYVPFGEVTENGYHVPYCLYIMLKERKFLNIRTRKGSNGRDYQENNYVPEFALEILPPLTPTELAQLATTQAASGTFLSANN